MATETKTASEIIAETLRRIEDYRVAQERRAAEFGRELRAVEIGLIFADVDAE
jgi:hypothetical protein